MPAPSSSVIGHRRIFHVPSSCACTVHSLFFANLSISYRIECALIAQFDWTSTDVIFSLDLLPSNANRTTTTAKKDGMMSNKLGLAAGLRHMVNELKFDRQLAHWITRANFNCSNSTIVAAQRQRRSALVESTSANWIPYGMAIAIGHRCDAN